jgi:hypothetical protein
VKLRTGLRGMQVDCGSLPEGLHFAEIAALDSTAPWRGPLFRIPVTVIKPIRVDSSSGDVSAGNDAQDASGVPDQAPAQCHMQGHVTCQG